MQKLTEIALVKADSGVFSRMEISCWLGGSLDRQFGLLKRALKAGEVVRVHRGLYCLAGKYLRGKIDPLVMAQRIHGPSYISLETALSRHGWIPEAVYTITSVCLDRSREFETPLGRFSFTRIPQVTLYTGVVTVCRDGGGLEDGSGYGRPGVFSREIFLLASPLKALADYVYVHKCDWTSSLPVVESLRVEESLLKRIEREAFDSLAGNYSSRRVQRFLEGLRRELYL
jgi:hypothetical protein